MKKHLYIILLISSLLLAQDSTSAVFKLNTEMLTKTGEVYTGANWRYHPGDDISWAAKSFNDSTWEIISSTLNSFELPDQEFPGKGWFRLHIIVDSLLIKKPLSFDIWLAGAAEVYINGEKALTYGTIFDDGTTENYSPSMPKVISFPQEQNVISVRYFNDRFDEMHSRRFTPGFFVQIGYPDQVVDSRFSYLHERYLIRTIFITISLVLALLHLFLFFFDRSQKQNLFYVLFLIFFTLFAYTNLSPFYTNNVSLLFLLYRLSALVLVLTILFGSTTINSIYRESGSSLFYFLLAGLAIGILAFFIGDVWVWYVIYAYIVIVSIWGSHVLYSPSYSRNSRSDWFLRIGFGLMGLMGLYQMLLSFDIVPNWGIGMPFLYGVVIFILSMSIALARDYVTTSKNLKVKLNEVQELSEKTLQQELEAKELDIQKRILEADNKRKTEELESARTVQLAMLPQCLNDIKDLDICFDMHTATEVGGDYYDYIISEDGTLNLVVGDATGHGMKAGIMVASIKSLFSALGVKMMIPDFFKKCTQIIKSMSLGNLFMSMIFIRIKNDTVIGSIAGMPPILIYRKDSNTIEEVLQKSMPLGGYTDFPYENFQFEFNTGDIILLMSDGYLELFNAEKKMLGEDKLKTYFLESADKNANDLVNYLLKKGNEWRKEHPQEDDITFVAIKKK